jgi:hypothetical protein
VVVLAGVVGLLLLSGGNRSQDDVADTDEDRATSRAHAQPRHDRPHLPSLLCGLTCEAWSALPTSLLPAGAGPASQAGAVRDPQWGLTCRPGVSTRGPLSACGQCVAGWDYVSLLGSWGTYSWDMTHLPGPISFCS